MSTSPSFYLTCLAEMADGFQSLGDLEDCIALGLARAEPSTALADDGSLMCGRCFGKIDPDDNWCRWCGGKVGR